jgi:hypothetical protein
LQCSLQYLPNEPPLLTEQLHAGWAHFASAMMHLWSDSTPVIRKSQGEIGIAT